MPRPAQSDFFDSIALDDDFGDTYTDLAELISVILEKDYRSESDFAHMLEMAGGA